jgi:hypothetical protein
LRILLVVGLVLALALFVYRAVRPYLKLIRQFFQTVRHFQSVGSTPASSTGQQREKLVKCETCNTWIPESRALAANSGEYCSQDCLSRAVVGRRKKKIG